MYYLNQSGAMVFEDDATFKSVGALLEYLYACNGDSLETARYLPLIRHIRIGDYLYYQGWRIELPVKTADLFDPKMIISPPPAFSYMERIVSLLVMSYEEGGYAFAYVDQEGTVHYATQDDDAFDKDQEVRGHTTWNAYKVIEYYLDNDRF
jgi:hypothetical protein